MGMHPLNINAQQAEAVYFNEFQNSIQYRMNSRHPGLYSETLSQKPKETNQQNKTKLFEDDKGSLKGND